MNPDLQKICKNGNRESNALKRFHLYCDQRILGIKRFDLILDHKPLRVSKDLRCIHESYKSLLLYTKEILTNKPQIWISKFESMDLFQKAIDESNLFSNYLYCGFD
jgi:hypothetical protein